MNRVGQTKASMTATAKESKVSSDDDIYKSKDKQIAQLNGTVASLTDAYKELRKMHEDLMKEHQQLLSKNGTQTEN